MTNEPVDDTPQPFGPQDDAEAETTSHERAAFDTAAVVAAAFPAPASSVLLQSSRSEIGQQAVGSAVGSPAPAAALIPGGAGADVGCSKIYDPAAGSTPEDHPAPPVAALATIEEQPPSTQVRRQARDPDGRHCRIYVRVTEDELARIRARAAASGVSAPCLLAELALLGPAGATERRAVNTAMLGIRRQIIGMATNLNQLARWANTRERLPADLEVTLAAVTRIETKVVEVLEALAAHRPRAKTEL